MLFALSHIYLGKTADETIFSNKAIYIKRKNKGSINKKLNDLSNVGAAKPSDEEAKQNHEEGNHYYIKVT